jgi:hypothetical protein
VLSPPALDYPARLPADIHAALVAEAEALLARYSEGKASFGWKDPRLSFTLPIWREACPDMAVIVAFRKPLSVLSSIAAQLERPIEPLAPLWLAYYRRIFAYTAGMPRHVVSYDDLLTDPAPVVLGMARHLGIAVEESTVRAKLAQIVKPQQSRHSSAQNAPNTSSMLDFQTLQLYAYLRDSVANGGQPDAAQLDKLLA